MFQIKDYPLIMKMMILPSFIIIISFILGNNLPENNRIDFLNIVLNTLSIGLPTMALLSIIYIIWIIRNYKDGIIISKSNKTIEYPSFFGRKTINILDYTDKTHSIDRMIYKLSLTGIKKPVVFKASSELIRNDISSKISITKDL